MRAIPADEQVAKSSTLGSCRTRRFVMKAKNEGSGMDRNLHNRADTQNDSPNRFPSGIHWATLLFGFVLVLSACAVQDSTAEPSTTPADVTTLAAGSTPTDGSNVTRAPATTTTRPSAPGVIRHATGFSLSYPEGWHETGIVISTEFAGKAECVAALIVDQAPPSDPAQAGFVLQSGVQVCMKPVDGDSLDTYMESVYGSLASEFVRSDSSGIVEYRRNGNLESHAFAQTDSYRYQVTTFVAADPELEDERLAQVQHILESLTFW